MACCVVQFLVGNWFCLWQPNVCTGNHKVHLLLCYVGKRGTGLTLYVLFRSGSGHPWRQETVGAGSCHLCPLLSPFLLSFCSHTSSSVLKPELFCLQPTHQETAVWLCPCYHHQRLHHQSFVEGGRREWTFQACCSKWTRVYLTR